MSSNPAIFLAEDHAHMARALELAARGLYSTDPNPRVGCVLVRGGEVVGEGWHEMAGGPHAEVHALRAAGERACGATAYVTLEPCCHHGRTPPCSDALLAAGVGRVVVAMVDPNPKVSGQGLRQLQAAGVRVASGVLEAEAADLNRGFIKRMRQGLPYVRAKIAMSLDGRTALASGESQWITGEAARLDVQRLRARSSAILTGIGTVLADDPRLTVRGGGLAVKPGRQPLRVVVDSGLRTPITARLLTQPGRTLIATAADRLAAGEALRAAGAETMGLPATAAGVDLRELLRQLAAREVNEVLAEAGARLNGALLAAGLVDAVVIYMAPLALGDAGRGLFHLPGLATMAQRVEFEIADVRAVGRDWRITARPIYH